MGWQKYDIELYADGMKYKSYKMSFENTSVEEVREMIDNWTRDIQEKEFADVMKITAKVRAISNDDKET